MSVVNFQLPAYSRPVVEAPRRYNIFHGGRGSGKSETAVRILLTRSVNQQIKVLCCREIQKSIAESTYSSIKSLINLKKLGRLFTIKNDSIIANGTGSKFIFKGLQGHTADSLKSIEGVDICFVEEAQAISKKSMDILLPTIRKPNSQFIMCMNPRNEDDPVYQMFIANNYYADDAHVIKCNWNDNPFFPKELEREKDILKKADPEAYLHVWEGELLTRSAAQVYKNYESGVVDNLGSYEGPFFGIDFGFSVSPTAIVSCYINMQHRIIYINAESGGKTGIEIEEIPSYLAKIPLIRGGRPIRGDESRPETISYVKRKGFNCISTEKLKTKVEDGIEFIRSFKIVVNPSCMHSLRELTKYSFKVDKHTDKIQDKVVKEHDHFMDALRYALEPKIMASRMGTISLY